MRRRTGRSASARKLPGELAGSSGRPWSARRPSADELPGVCWHVRQSVRLTPDNNQINSAKLKLVGP